MSSCRSPRCRSAPTRKFISIASRTGDGRDATSRPNGAVDGDASDGEVVDWEAVDWQVVEGDVLPAAA
jgi:hypothetical protein